MIIVEVDQNLKTAEKFIPLAPVIFRELEINLENEQELENISQLQLLLEKKIDKLLTEIRTENTQRNYEIEAVIIRLIIKGRTKLHKFVGANREELEETLQNEFKNKYLKSNPYLQIDSIYLRTARTLANLEKIKEKNILYQNLEKLLAEIFENQDLKEELLAEWGEIWQGEENQEARSNYKFYAAEKEEQEILEEAKKIIISELLEAGD